MTPADWEAIALSLRVAIAATALALVPGVGVALVLARVRRAWTGVLELAVAIPLVLPPVVTGYALLLVLPRGVLFTWGAAVLASAVVGFPLLVQIARVGIEAVDPDLEAAARIDGASRADVLRRVTLPLASPAIAAGAALHFARALGEFGATIVVAGNIPGRTQTLPLALFARLHQAGGEGASLRLAVAAVVVSAGCLVVYRWLLGRLAERSA